MVKLLNGYKKLICAPSGICNPNASYVFLVAILPFGVLWRNPCWSKYGS